MKVLVDTSCWIQAFRNQDSFEASVIGTLLKEDSAVTSSLIVAELLQGVKTSKETLFLKRHFDVIPTLSGIDNLGIHAGELGHHLKKRGYEIGILDLVLAVLALKHKVFVYSLDKHFKVIAKFISIKLFVPMKH